MARKASANSADASYPPLHEDVCLPPLPRPVPPLRAEEVRGLTPPSSFASAAVRDAAVVGVKGQSSSSAGVA